MTTWQTGRAYAWWFWVLALLGVALTLSLVIFPLVTVPAEDAIILHVYSRNLAEHGEIAYNAVGPRAEGATDFLWMVYLSLGMKLHIRPELSSGVANVFCAFGLAWVLLRLAKRRWQWPVALAITGALALLPQLQSSLIGFSVLPFGFGVALMVLFSEEQRDAPLAVVALLLCLLRPDGVVFAVPLMVRRMWLQPSWRQAGIFAGVFAVPGLIYFLARWHYFGYFFPLPYYVKSDTQRVLGWIDPGNWNIWPYLTFSLAVIAIVLHRAWSPRMKTLLAAVVLVPALFYLRMRLDQNWNGRFFFFLPLLAAIVLAVQWDALASRRNRVLAAVAVLYLLTLARPERFGIASSIQYQTDLKARRVLAVAMNDPALRGTMLASETGLFPFYSRWQTFDPWGLNTAEFALRTFQPGDVARLHPDVVMLHTDSCSVHSEAAHADRTWKNMLANVQTGIAQAGGYDVLLRKDLPYANLGPLLRLHQGEGEQLCWYIARSYAGHDAMKALLLRNGSVPVDPAR